MKKLAPASLCIALLLGVMGCSSGGLDASGDEFSGLDKSTVKEVLDNATAKERAKGFSGEQLKSMYQGMVMNFTYCRETYQAYRSWLETGTTPATPTLPQPTHPYADAIASMKMSQQTVRGRIASGDVSELRGYLTAESGCGVWVPLKPGDQSGQTIADAVKRA